MQDQLEQELEIHRFFGLKENCFSPSPNPRYLYRTEQTDACLFKARYVIKERQGLSVIIGRIGFGKTSVLRYLVDGYLDKPQYKVVLLPNGEFPSQMQFALAISRELDIPPRRSLLAQTEEIRDAAFEIEAAGGTIILAVDEAQALRGPQFDLLRSLLNYETNEAKVIQIVLAGQPEIEAKIRQKAAFKSRIVLTSYLDSFTYQDMLQALQYRITIAGGKQLAGIINEEGLKRLYRVSKGIPREIVKIVNSAMIGAVLSSIKPMNADLIDLGYENMMKEEEEDAREEA